VQLKSHSGTTTATLMIPATARLTVESINCTITVSNIGGAVDIHSVSGNVDVTNASQELKLETVSGKIRVANASAKISAKTISGAIEFGGVSGETTAESVSGDIAFTGSRPAHAFASATSGNVSYEGDVRENGWYDFQTYTGNVRLRLPANTNASVEVESTIGRVRNGFTNARRLVGGSGDARTQFRYALGNGGARVNVVTTAGFVAVMPQ
jgi:hypothetical protein